MQQTAMRTTITNQARRIAMLAAILLLPALAHAQSYTVAPQTFGTVLDDSGRIVVGGCVWTYAAGTTTPIATYSNSTGTLNANPIVADYAGRYTAFLVAGTNYKFIYENVPCSSSSHGTVLRTADNIAGNPSSSATVDITCLAGETISAGQAVYQSSGTGGKTPGQCYKADSTNPYSSITATVLGIAPSAIVSGSTGTVRIAGLVQGLASLSTGSDYYVGVAGALTSTAPGNARKLGGADSTTSLILTLPPNGWTVVTTTSVGTQNDFAPGLSGPTLTIVRCNNASLLTITGITGGVVGQRILFIPVGAGQVDFAFNSGSSLAANRLINFITVGNTSMAPGSTSEGAVEYVYDSSNRWMMVQHEQGAPIAFTPTITFNSASVGQTYSSQVGFYYVKGKVLHYWGRLTLTAKGSSTGGAAIAGLPYTSNTTVGLYGTFICPLYANLATITSPFMGYIAPSSTAVTLQMGGAASTAGLTEANFTNTSDLLFSGSYALQ